MIPSLQLIDRMLMKKLYKYLRKLLGLNTEYAIEILRNRLGLMMHRRTKSEVAQTSN